MRVAVRPYADGDGSGLMHAIEAVCAEGMMRTRHFEPTPPWRHALEEADCDCHLLLVATDGPHISGWCRLFSTQNRNALELGIGVVKSYRQRGVGSALLSKGLKWAAGRGADVVLQTRVDNRAAIHLFRSHDFRSGTRKGGLLLMDRPAGNVLDE